MRTLFSIACFAVALAICSPSLASTGKTKKNSQPKRSEPVPILYSETRVPGITFQSQDSENVHMTILPLKLTITIAF